MRDTHRADGARHARRRRATSRRPGRGGDCCGALHVHAGRDDEARALARRVIASMPGDAPIVVDSAGCGAAMKDYGRLLGTAEAHAFAARVRDFSEWLAEHGRSRRARDRRRRVVVQDPCHLRHVQKAHGAVRTVLGAGVRRCVETDDDGLCCGAGGAYAVLAARARRRRSATARSPRSARRRRRARRGRRVGQPRLRDAPRAAPGSTSAIPPSCSPRHSMNDRDYEAIAERLAAIEEELRDLAYERLREARTRSRQRRRRAAERDEKRLAQARRAIAKAINALRTIDD